MRVIGTAGHVDHGRRALVEAVRAKARVQGEITARELRDRFGTTRKYIIGLLEHPRATGVTTRVGDAPVLAE